MFWHSKIRIVATQEVRLCHLRLLATKLIDQILCQSLYSYLSKIYNFFFRNITVTVIGLLRAELSIHSREDTFLLALCPQKEY